MKLYRGILKVKPKYSNPKFREKLFPPLVPLKFKQMQNQKMAIFLIGFFWNFPPPGHWGESWTFDETPKTLLGRNYSQKVLEKKKSHVPKSEKTKPPKPNFVLT